MIADRRRHLKLWLNYLFAVAVSLALGGVSSAVACSFRTPGIFTPTLERWEQHPGPAQKDPGSEGEYWEGVPEPIAVVSRIIRGKAEAGSSCDDAGIVEIIISLPSSSSYSIDEFGAYFRVRRGETPDEIFPDSPLKGFVENKKARFLLVWLDGHPSKQRPIDIDVEIFLVTNSLNIGPATIINIQADGG